MNILGGLSLIVMLISGSVLFIGSIGWVDVAPPFLGQAVVLGWFATAIAIVLYVIATIRYVIGRFDDYWNSLFPLTFGVSLLGGAFIGYVPGKGIVLILLAIASASVLGVALIKTRLLYVKWLPIIAVLPILIPSYNWWSILIIGVLFVTVGVFSLGKKLIGRNNEARRYRLTCQAEIALVGS